MDDQTNDPKVVEGELVAPEGAEELINVTNLIKTYINKMDVLTGSMRKAQEMLTDLLDNDEEYRTKVDEVKKITKDRNTAKQRVLNIPQARDLSEKLKEAKSSLKEMKDTLSEYLTEYARMTGSTEFEDETGQMHKIVYMAKLIKQ